MNEHWLEKGIRGDMKKPPHSLSSAFILLQQNFNDSAKPEPRPENKIQTENAVYAMLLGLKGSSSRCKNVHVIKGERIPKK